MKSEETGLQIITLIVIALILTMIFLLVSAAVEKVSPGNGVPVGAGAVLLVSYILVRTIISSRSSK